MFGRNDTDALATNKEVSSEAIQGRILGATITMCVISLVAVTTNTIILILMDRKQPANFLSKCYGLIRQLAIADLIMGVAYTITGFKRLFLFLWKLKDGGSQFYCISIQLGMFLGIESSAVFSLLIALDRLLALACPVKYKVTGTKKYLGIVRIIGWGYCGATIAAAFIGVSFDRHIPACTVVGSVTKSYYWWNSVSALVICFATLIIYGLVVNLVVRKLAKAKKQQQNMATVKHEIEYKMIKTIAIIVVIYCATSLSSRTSLYLIKDLESNQKSVIGPYIRCLQIVNSGINLFVYIWRDSRFKATLKGAVVDSSSKVQWAKKSRIAPAGGTTNWGEGKQPRSIQPMKARANVDPSPYLMEHLSQGPTSLAEELPLTNLNAIVTISK